MLEPQPASGILLPGGLVAWKLQLGKWGISVLEEIFFGTKTVEFLPESLDSLSEKWAFEKWSVEPFHSDIIQMFAFEFVRGYRRFK